MPFAERCAAALVDYVGERGNEPGPLFLAATHLQALTVDVPLKANGLKQLLRRLGRRTGIKKVHAHLWDLWGVIIRSAPHLRRFSGY